MKPFLRAAVAALAFACLPTSAGTLADLYVVSRSTGERLPVYAHGGKLYVAGEPGERYAIQVINRTGRRILAVVSVDGVNVVTGETASPDQTGYVFSPWQSYEIAGWRKNAGEVAAFYFTALPDSYAARTGRAHDVGVIGLAVFREWAAPRHRPHPYPHPRRMESAGEPETDAAAAAREQASGDVADETSPESGASERSVPHAPLRQRDRLGTGHGEREHSAVTFTDFRRANPHPAEVLAIHYDRRENLIARGIIPSAPHYAEPRPFPGPVRFVPDPGR